MNGMSGTEPKQKHVVIDIDKLFFSGAPSSSSSSSSSSGWKVEIDYPTCQEKKSIYFDLNCINDSFALTKETFDPNAKYYMSSSSNGESRVFECYLGNKDFESGSYLCYRTLTPNSFIIVNNTVRFHEQKHTYPQRSSRNHHVSELKSNEIIRTWYEGSINPSYWQGFLYGLHKAGRTLTSSEKNHFRHHICNSYARTDGIQRKFVLAFSFEHPKHYVPQDPTKECFIRFGASVVKFHFVKGHPFYIEKRGKHGKQQSYKVRKMAIYRLHINPVCITFADYDKMENKLLSKQRSRPNITIILREFMKTRGFYEVNKNSSSSSSSSASSSSSFSDSSSSTSASMPSSSSTDICVDKDVLKNAWC